MLNNNAATRVGSDASSDTDHSEHGTDTSAEANTSTAAAARANTEKAKSAAAEIAVSDNVSNFDPVGDAIKRCKAVAKGESVFKASVAHIYEGLTVAYPTYLLIKDNKASHQRVIDELMAKGDRERMPSLGKATYNATVLACHPDNPEDYSNCSDWAHVLALADMDNVPVGKFRGWVQDKKIGETKRKVRAAKQAKKPLKTPFTWADFPALAYVFAHCDDERMRDLSKTGMTSLNDQVGELLAEMGVVVS